jgi:hypothetical protein
MRNLEEFIMEDKETVIPEETICGNHNEVIWLLRQYKKFKDMWYIDQAIKLVRYCKKQGQNMENHMAKTKAIIESLGYKRVYKARRGKKLKSWQK